MRNSFLFILIGVLFFLNGCAGIQVVPEPNLEQVTVYSETICSETPWYSPFCTKGKSRSFMIKGIYNNSNGDKKYYLDYYLDLLDTDLPVGLSLYLNGTYYNLKKMSTDYSDILNIESELSSEVISKLNSVKSEIQISYSNRRNTTNFYLSSSDSKKLISQINEVIKKISDQEKLKIVK